MLLVAYLITYKVNVLRRKIIEVDDCMAERFSDVNSDLPHVLLALSNHRFCGTSSQHFIII